MLQAQLNGIGVIQPSDVVSYDLNTYVANSMGTSSKQQQEILEGIQRQNLGMVGDGNLGMVDLRANANDI